MKPTKSRGSARGRGRGVTGPYRFGRFGDPPGEASPLLAGVDEDPDLEDPPPPEPGGAGPRAEGKWIESLEEYVLRYGRPEPEVYRARAYHKRLADTIQEALGIKILPAQNRRSNEHVRTNLRSEVLQYLVLKDLAAEGVTSVVDAGTDPTRLAHALTQSDLRLSQLWCVAPVLSSSDRARAAQLSKHGFDACEHTIPECDCAQPYGADVLTLFHVIYYLDVCEMLRWCETRGIRHVVGTYMAINANSGVGEEGEYSWATIGGEVSVHVRGNATPYVHPAFRPESVYRVDGGEWYFYHTRCSGGLFAFSLRKEDGQLRPCPLSRHVQRFAEGRFELETQGETTVVRLRELDGLDWKETISFQVQRELFNTITTFAASANVSTTAQNSLIARVGRLAPDIPADHAATLAGVASIYAHQARALSGEAAQSDVFVGPGGEPTLPTCWRRFFGDALLRRRLAVAAWSFTGLTVVATAVTAWMLVNRHHDAGTPADGMLTQGLGQPSGEELAALVVLTATVVISAFLWLMYWAVPLREAYLRKQFMEAYAEGRMPKGVLRCDEVLTFNYRTLRAPGVEANNQDHTPSPLPAFVFRPGPERQRHTTLVGLGIEGLVWVPFNGSFNNVDRALWKRLIEPSEHEPTEETFERADRVRAGPLRHWCDWQCTSLDEEEELQLWLEGLTPAQRHRVAESHQGLHLQAAWGPNRDISIFLKVEASVLLWPGSFAPEVQTKAPRIIYPTVDWVRVHDRTYLWTAWARQFKARQALALREMVLPTVVWAGGNISVEAGEWLERVAGYVEDPVFMGYDMSKADKNQKWGWLHNSWKFASSVYAGLEPDGPPRKMKIVYGAPYASLKATLDACRQSGGHDTTPGNTINSATCAQVAHDLVIDQGGRPIYFLINGDDGLVVCTRGDVTRTVEALDQAYTLSGLPVKVEEPCEPWDLEFCQRWPCRFQKDGQIVIRFVPKIGRVLSRSGWNPVHEKLDLKALGSGMSTECSQVPVLSRLAELYKRVGTSKGARPPRAKYYALDGVLQCEETLMDTCARYLVVTEHLKRAEQVLDSVASLPCLVSIDYFRPFVIRDTDEGDRL